MNIRTVRRGKNVATGLLLLARTITQIYCKMKEISGASTRDRAQWAPSVVSLLLPISFAARRYRYGRHLRPSAHCR
jgi:hypothetical protein